MKKIIKTLAVVLCLFELSSCNDSEKKKEPQPQGNLMITEFIQNGFNSALELYNYSEKEIDLGSYRLKLAFEDPQYINLSGKLGAKQTYIIAYNSDYVNEEIKNKANLLTDNLFYSGKLQIIVENNNKAVDVLGVEGSQYEYCKDRGIVRKQNYLRPTTNFDEYEWIRYPKTTLTNLGNVNNTVTEEELLEGPKIDISVAETSPYISETNSTLGGGGFVTVTVRSYGDGDTTTFNIPTYLGFGSYSSVRYQNVDTRETMSNMTQEWGVPAKNYTNERLRNAKRIQLQSVLNAPLQETFERMLAWVWIDGTLQNFMLVKEGYSDVAFGENESIYKGIYYYDWLYHAKLYAKRNKLKIHGEKDPYWDYTTNTPKS